jgi:hypothetical protein
MKTSYAAEGMGKLIDVVSRFLMLDVVLLVLLGVDFLGSLPSLRLSYEIKNR